MDGWMMYRCVQVYVYEQNTMHICMYACVCAVSVLRVCCVCAHVCVKIYLSMLPLYHNLKLKNEYHTHRCDDKAESDTMYTG